MDENRLKSWIVKILPSKKAEEAVGTGFWAAEGGYILTCTHVIEGLNPPWIAYGKKKAPAKVKKQEGDITLLQVQKITGEIAPLDMIFPQREDIIDSLGYQYEGVQGLGYFPMKGTVLGQSELDGMETLTLEEAIHVKPGASGAPALNRRTGKVVGIISNKWEKQQIAFALSLNAVIKKWEILKPRFHSVDYRREDIFDFYDTFAGREKEIEIVRDFVKKEEGGYLLIQGSAGKGKTALVAELARIGAQKELSPHVCCLVFFIREEGGWNKPTLLLDSLNRQFLELLEDREEIPISLEDKKRQYSRLLEKVKSQVFSQNRLLILIDGLDELVKEDFQTIIDILPKEIPPCIYWVLTSRPEPDVQSAVPKYHALRRALSYNLPGLGIHDVRELLHLFRDKNDKQDEKDNKKEWDNSFIEELITRTNGDPLFLRFICEDISGIPEEEMNEYLKKLPEGVIEYFEQQLEFLKNRVKENKSLKDYWETPFDILKILLVSYSGLTPEEMEGILKVKLWVIQDSLELIKRFLLGRKRRELMHKEFSKAIEKKFLGKKEKKKFLKKMINYCKTNWKEDDINEEYAVRHYLRHLSELKQYQEMFDLCNSGYLEVKLTRLLSPELLEEDYHALFEACKELEDLNRLLRWGIQRARISDEVAAFRDISDIPEVIGKLAQKGKKDWWERGVGICALIPGAAGKMKGFLGLCQGLEPGKREMPDEVFGRVRELLGEILPSRSKDELIAGYVKELCRWKIIQLEETLDAAVQIEDEFYRSEALAAVAEGYGQLQDVEKAAAGLTQVLEAATQIRHERYRSESLTAVARGYGQLSDKEKALTGFTQVLKAASQNSEWFYSQWLSCLAQWHGQLPDLKEAVAGLGWVLDKASQIGDKQYRSEALAAVAKGYAQLNDIEKAIKVLKQGLDAAVQIKDEIDGYMALAAVAEGYGRLPDGEKAAAGLTQVLEAATQIIDEFDRSMALAAVAKGYGQLKDVEKAAVGLTQVLEAASRIIDELNCSRALAAVAKGYGQLKDMDKATIILKQALDAATQIEDEDYYSMALAMVARVYGQLSDSEKAAVGLTQVLDAAIWIGEERCRSEALSAVAWGYGQLKDVEKVATGLTQVLDTAARIRYELEGPWALAGVAWGYRQLKNLKKAAKILQQALDAAVQIGNGQHRSEALAAVAESYGQLTDVDKAAKILKQVYDNAVQIGYEEERAGVLEAVARVYGQLPDGEKAAAGLTQVFEAAFRIGDEQYRSWVLAEVAESYGQLPDGEKAAAGLTQVFDTSTQIEDESFRSRVLAAVALGYGWLPDGKKAAAGLTQVFETTTQIKNEDSRSQILGAVAWGYGQLKNLKKAATGLSEVLDVASQIRGERDRSRALVSVARGYGHLQNVKKMAKILKQAYNTAVQIGDERWRSEALTAVAEGYGHLKDIEKAAAGLSEVLEVAIQNGDENIIAVVARGYAQVMLVQRAYDLLPSISGDWAFSNTCIYIFFAATKMSSKDKASVFLKDAFFRILPLASQRSRQVYLQVVQQALPSVVKHLPKEQAHSILEFLEEQWKI